MRERSPRLAVLSQAAGSGPAEAGLHSRPESAKQVVGTLTLRVITRYGGIGAMRPGARLGRDRPQTEPSVAGIDPVCARQNEFRRTGAYGSQDDRVR